MSGGCGTPSPASGGAQETAHYETVGTAQPATPICGDTYDPSMNTYGKAAAELLLVAHNPTS